MLNNEVAIRRRINGAEICIVILLGAPVQVRRLPKTGPTPALSAAGPTYLYSSNGLKVS
jgi:hypothetical protein